MSRKLKSAAVILLGIVMFLSGITGLVAMILNNSFAPTGKIGLSVADPTYNAMMYDTVSAELERKMALVAISMDDISDIVNEDEISRAAPEAAVILARRFLGVTDKAWEYENEKLRVRIDEKLTAYAEANGIEYKEGSADEVYNMICDTVSDELNLVSQNYIEKISPYMVKVRALCSYWVLPIVVFFLSCAGILIIGRHRIRRAVYNCVLPAYLAAFAVFALSAVLYGKDYLAKTVLGDGALQYYIRGIYNSVLSDIKSISGIFVLLHVILAAAIIAAIIVDHRNKRKKKHRHRPRHDKNKPLKRRFEPVKPPKALPEEMSVDEIIRRNEEIYDYIPESAEDIAKDFYTETSEDEEFAEDIDITKDDASAEDAE